MTSTEDDASPQPSCAFYMSNGRCKFGSKCRFSHDINTKNQIPICLFFQQGFCKYGESCKYAHIRTPEPVSPTNTVKKVQSIFCTCPINAIDAVLNKNEDATALAFTKVAEFSRHITRNFMERMFKCSMDAPYPVFTFPQSNVSLTIKPSQEGGGSSPYGVYTTSFQHRYCVFAWLERKLQIGFCLIDSTAYRNDFYYAVSVSIAEYRSLTTTPLKVRMQIPFSLPTAALQRKKGTQFVEKMKRLPADQLLVKILDIVGDESPTLTPLSQTRPRSSNSIPLSRLYTNQQIQALLMGSNLFMGFGSNKSFQLVSSDTIVRETESRDDEDVLNERQILNPDEELENFDITRPTVVDLEDHIDVRSIQTVICGDNCTFLITEEGRVWARGLNGNTCRFIGLDSHVEIAETFMLVEGELVDERVVDIAAHPEVDTTFQLGHTFFLTESGKVYSTGCNTSGALALDGDTPLVLPAQVITSGFDQRVATHIAVSQRSSIIITDNDRIWLCGMTLDEGDDAFRIAQPTDIGWEHEAISMIACGSSHCVILARSGKVFSFGSNKQGQCGFPEHYPVHYPCEILNPEQPDYARHRFIDISCKGNHTVLLQTNGVVWVFGNNESGVLGIDNGGENIFMPTKLDALFKYPIVRVDTGFKQSLFVADHDCFVCGEKDDSFHTEPQPLKWTYKRSEKKEKPIYMRDNYMKNIGNGTDHFIFHFIPNENVRQFKELLFVMSINNKWNDVTLVHRKQ